MKRNCKRGVSAVLVLVLLVSLLAGLVLPAHAADYVYNWGHRGDTATALSSYATAFYGANGTSYEALAVLEGSADVGSVPSSALYGQLKSLMAGSHSHITGYDETKDLYRYTDCQDGGGAISAFYSGKEIGPDWDGLWNREHTWPNSKGLSGDDENDIMMLRPTSTSENSGRGNTAYGSGSGFYNPNKESGGKYDLRGDVCRIALYVYVRWGNATNMWGKDGVIESKDVLLNWMLSDPVDTWEMGRNDAVQSITGTRNVFVDYPELAFLLFDAEIPSTMVTPSGKAGETHTVTATVNDEAMGSVSISGNNINALPAEGYMVDGYEILSGSATVTRNGNAFTVSAFSDCTIRVIFAPKVAVTVTYLSDGTPLTPGTAYSGDTITLPDYEGTAPEGYTFLGWSDVTVSHSENIPAYYLPEDSYTVTEDTALHALFTYVASGSSTDSGIWTLVTDESQLAAGQQVVLASTEKAVVSAPIQDGKQFLFKENAVFAPNFETITTMPENAQTFTLGGSAGSWTFAKEDGKLLGATAVKKLAYGKGSTTWTISIENGSATIQNTTQSYGRFLYNASSPRFTTYTSNTSGSMLLPQLYFLDSGAGITYYTTVSCRHDNTEEVPAKDATCTTDGYTAGVYCSDCASYISGHDLISAFGHSYSAQVTPPTADTDGYTTYTCAVCGHSYVGDTVPALGETYTVSFSVPDDVKGFEDLSCNNSGITLPEAAVPADAKEAYAFLGWTTAPLDETEELPVYFEAGTSYVASSDITLYALYVRTEGGTGETAYVLVEDASQLTVGSKVVIASAPDAFALSTKQNGNNRGQAEITKNDNKTITLGDGVAELVLGEGTKENTWSFYCAANEGYLYAASSSSNHLRTKKTLDDNGSFAIVLDENGVAAVTAQGTSTRNQLKHNKQNKIFACYGSGQQDVSLYIETVDGTVTYTTNISHVHKGAYREAVPATCTEPGTVAHYACSCGMNFADEACTKVLTTISVALKAHTFTAETAEEDYLKSAANCASAAVYYLSCEYCGLTSRDTQWEATFLSGEADPDTHTGETYLSGQKDATCTIDGYSGDTHCSGCKEKLSSGETLPAGHKLTKVDAAAATHEADGVVEHYSCSVCRKLFADGEATKELTAAEVVIPKQNHSYGSYKTDKDNHWKECSCGSIADKGKHTFGSWKTVKKAEENVKGLKERTCSVCGYVESEEIPAATSPSTGDMFLVLLVIMIGSFCGIFGVNALRTPKGKYLR